MEKFTNANLASRLMKLIGDRSLTQKVVASECGISAAALSGYLGNRIPKAEELYALARFFGVTMEFLLTGAASPTATSSHPSEDIQRWRDRAREAENKVEFLKAGMQGLLKKI